MVKEKQIATTVKQNQVSIFEGSDMGDVASMLSSSMQVSATEISRPTLTLTQSLSKAFKSGNAKTGEFYCDMKSENYGSSPILIPLMVTQNAGYYDKDKEELLCSALGKGREPNMFVNRDGVKCSNCPFGAGTYFGNWDEKTLKAQGLKKPRCQLSYDFFFLIKKEDGTIDPLPMKFSFRSMSYKAGRSLFNKLNTHPRINAGDKSIPIPFYYGYILGLEKEPRGNYFIKEKSEQRVVLTPEDMATLKPVFMSFMKAVDAGAIDTSFDAKPSDDDIIEQSDNDIEIDNSFPI